MLSSRYLLIPFAAQMLCMTVDEFHFHWRRKLPRWERIGHPLDTLTVLACLYWVLLAPPAPASVAVYVGLSVFSCLFVTKDEWVHAKTCAAGEHWLHAMLFALHPLILICAGLLWPARYAGGASALAGWIRYEGFENTFLVINAALTTLFALYQFVYWNLLWKPGSKARSTT
ncbi:MAG TPA: hypothetical protein VFD58_17670 [Blastocatellia bacterium]|nr:hypothetical protein [Blastocatellia bacterium]